ncbi:hypothetical protein [Pelagibius sp.]|uniref:hypothetical protein n=1 Tax=Pelagibius sp. TaxID=1931238 RepID=UPI003B509209
MARAGRGSAYLGAAVFAGAAVIAALAAMVAHGVPHPDYGLSETIWIRSILCLSAGISAALSFILVRRFNWRLRCEPLWGRALVVCGSTLAVAHLLIGVVFSSMILLVRMTLPETPFWASGEILYDLILTGFLAAVFGWYFTLPGGFAAALLLEWLEMRQSRPPSGRAKAVE